MNKLGSLTSRQDVPRMNAAIKTIVQALDQRNV
jgi:6-phosphofructokinase